MRRLIWAFALILLMTACRTLAPVPSPTVTPAETLSLPPEATATASATPLPTLAPTPLAPRALADQAEALLDPFDGDVMVLDGATVYTIEATVEFDGTASIATIDGTARIRYTHKGPDLLDD
ncbi:MAG: hypothetical protein WBR18_01050, partial [Anaerolineales bacterium]